jgi:hypothetical protein
MVLASEVGPGEDPYWYARVIGIFHAQVRYVDPHTRTIYGPFKMDFVWVRWFGPDSEYKAGWGAKRLPRLSFVPVGDGIAPSDVFGFLDPKDIIRGAHLIPAFMHEQTPDRLGSSIARQPTENDLDWDFYHVNM